MLRWHFLTTRHTHTHTNTHSTHLHVARGKHLCCSRKSVAYAEEPATQFTYNVPFYKTATHVYKCMCLSLSLALYVCVCVFNVEIMDDNFNDNST